MRPTSDTDDSARHFKFVCYFRMSNIHKYQDRIKLSTPGVGQAYSEKRLVHLLSHQMDRSIDDYPNHVWSINIESQSGPRCVLNVDTSDSILSDEQIASVDNTISDLSKVIAKYNPGSIAFE